jgi:type VI secretion system protein VasD
MSSVQNMRRHGVIAVGLAVILLLGGCAKSVQVRLVTAAQVNPGIRATALPVVVRLYQLSDDESFRQASFRDLWQRDKVVLGNTLLATKSVTLLPDNQKDIRIARHPQARYFAAVALFRQPDGQQWRIIQPVTGRVQLVLVDNQLQVLP